MCFVDFAFFLQDRLDLVGGARLLRRAPRRLGDPLFRIVDPVGNAEACIDAGDRVSTPLNPGENSRGLVILDVPEGPGSAAFVVGGFQGSYGWEWRW